MELSLESIQVGSWVGNLRVVSCAHPPATDISAFCSRMGYQAFERSAFALALGLQIAQSRSYLYTLGPKVGIIYLLGALGYLGPDMEFKGLSATSV